MSDVNVSLRDGWDTPYVDESDALDDPADDAGGTTPEQYSMPDQAPRVEILTAIETAIRATIEAERKRMETINEWEYNSKEVLFQRFTVPAGQPIQIVREKNHRGNIVITNYTDLGTVSIGLHAGIRSLGTDTVSVVGVATSVSANPRTIRTRRALWAVANVACEIDVQEEFQ